MEEECQLIFIVNICTKTSAYFTGKEKLEKVIKASNSTTLISSLLLSLSCFSILIFSFMRFGLNELKVKILKTSDKITNMRVVFFTVDKSIHFH